MAEVVLATESEKQIWDASFLKETVRASRFLPYMGKGVTNIIMMKHELETEAGKTINIPLVTRLTNKGVGGSTALRGRETQIGNYNCPITIDWDRNAIVVPKSESYKTEIDFLNAGKPLLKQWAAEALRTDIIYALMSVIPSGNTTVPYAEITDDTTNGGYKIAAGYVPETVFDRYEGVSWTSASEAQKDAWLALNSDRVLFGALRSNISANDHSAALTTLDTTADKASTSIGSLGKRMAGQANPHITPFMTEDGREYFVAFHGSRTFRDLKADSTITQANREARPRDIENNPLFQDGDLIYDGIMHREVPEIDTIAAAGTYNLDGKGNSNCDVRPVFLCGQGAVGIAWGQEPTPQTDMDKDYKFRPGVAIEELLGVKKLVYNAKQYGMVSCFFAAAADS